MIAPRIERPLRGIIVREEKDTLVVQANEVEVARFTQTGAREVDVQAATLRVGLSAGVNWATTGDAIAGTLTPGVISMGEPLYDRQGRPVAILDDVRVDVARIDVTAFGDTVRNFIQGATHVHIRAHGVPGVTVR